MLLKFSQALLRFIMCITYLIAFLPCTLHAMPTHHALQRLYMLSVLRKGSESEGSAGVVLERVKHFFFNPDVSLNFLGGFALTVDKNSKCKRQMHFREIHSSQDRGNIVFLEAFLVRKIFCNKESPRQTELINSALQPPPLKMIPPTAQEHLGMFSANVITASVSGQLFKEPLLLLSHFNT